jgi:DNA repair protein RadA/Sms
MAKKEYVCRECGYVNSKWLGKCPDCKNWNTFEEKIQEKKKNGFPVSLTKSVNNHSKSIYKIIEESGQAGKQQIYNFSTEILNQFWGQGLVAGSLTLLAGEPGLGKSTLGLQLLRALVKSKNGNLKFLYVTAEETSLELARRSQRLEIPDEILILQSSNFEKIVEVIKFDKPDILVIDSIQTIYSEEIGSAVGSVSQVSTLTNRFLSLSKTLNLSIILIGHVTKEGQIAGPKTLEHMVDSVLLLESTENSKYRTLSFSKNRFGSADEILLLKMEENGLQIISDPSLALLENIETGIGICYGLGMNKNLPFVTEIQALVSTSNSEQNYFGKREALGLSNSKLNTILAIAEKYLKIRLKSADVYVQLTGIAKNIQDDSLDLPIIIAILSSLNNQTIDQFLNIETKKKAIFAGRLTLSGKLRKPTNLELRQTTAKKLGFEYNPGVAQGDLKKLF